MTAENFAQPTAIIIEILEIKLVETGDTVVFQSLVRGIDETSASGNPYAPEIGIGISPSGMGIQIDAQTLESGSDRQLRVKVAPVVLLVHLIGHTGISVQPGLLQGEIERIEPLQLTLVGPVDE